MPQVTVHVNDKLIDKSTRKELKALKTRVSRLKNKVNKLERQMAEDQEVVLTARRIINAVKDAGGFMDWDEYGNNA